MDNIYSQKLYLNFYIYRSIPCIKQSATQQFIVNIATSNPNINQQIPCTEILLYSSKGAKTNELKIAKILGIDCVFYSKLLLKHCLWRLPKKLVFKPSGRGGGYSGF